ncbi:MAG: hypothetical protein CVT68_05320 [Actinobacteria bacterium HGW-Actinobacteria-8]|nr:MAG: hypothetical protein CVT68_05320 [Actinobacteria bacterium HGW-Actinobacteria-8]
MSTLTRADVDRVRLSSLLIAEPADPGRTVLSIVEHFLAMQAQASTNPFTAPHRILPVRGLPTQSAPFSVQL